jgi:hypothetical protein
LGYVADRTLLQASSFQPLVLLRALLPLQAMGAAPFLQSRSEPLGPFTVEHSASPGYKVQATLAF